MKKVGIVCLAPVLALVAEAAGPGIEFVPQFENTHHPEIAYWFFNKDMLASEKYLATLDQLAQHGLYTTVFLTARNGVDFYDFSRMHPILSDLVAQAHKRGLKVGLQIWESKKPVAPENMERAVVEGEILLDDRGEGSYTGKTRHVRTANGPPIRSELYRAYAFEKTGAGFYAPGSLQDITNLCPATSPDAGTVKVEIHGGPPLRGRTVYLMTQHFYNFSTNHGADAANRFLEALHAYRDIPFDGVALDEYTNLRIVAPWELEKPGGVFRERTTSPAMSQAYQAKYHEPLVQAMLDMRYAPFGHPEVRMRAINTYMDVMRRGPLNVEEAVYNGARATFGPSIFSGFHNTHHNALPYDEIWVTGLNWWTLPRFYGHTDERSPLPTQMGIAMSAPGNAMYNMFYDKSVDVIAEKALNDLRYGIRTIYHAVNDVQGWGVSVEKSEPLAVINPVERCARLLNRFNPSLPKIRLLVIFGIEALSAWYPNESERGAYDINDKLAIEEKAVSLWKAGYLNALVSSDVIVAGKLKLDRTGHPVMNGHTYDAVIYLYPEYAREPVLQFLEHYVAQGGRLMLEGVATHDFLGTPMKDRFDAISRRAAATAFSIAGVAKLGLPRDRIENGALNEDGSYVFTDWPSLRSATPARFEVHAGRDTYRGEYHGLAAISIDGGGKLEKLAASGLMRLQRNGVTIFSLPHPADAMIERESGQYRITVAGTRETSTPAVNRLGGELK
jgi:hypothetical protein